MDPKVSVSLITYNQAAFVAQAIESVLMQETDFPYEILIGEDGSNDGTRDIVVEYAQKHPGRIRLFLHDRKNVIYIGGKPTGRYNLVYNLRHAQGMYVALLEGDDYWTSPYKLQRQAAFLDSHPEFAICFHPVVRSFEREGVQTATYRTSRPPKTTRARTDGCKDDVFTLRDLLEGNLIAACSVMYRNHLPWGDFPEWYFTVPMGDWPLHILNAQYGDIGYIDEAMSVYRIHAGGIRSSRRASQKLRASIALLETVREHLGSEYRRQLNDGIARRKIELVYRCLCDHDFVGARSAVSGLTATNRIPIDSWARGAAHLSQRTLWTVSAKLSRSVKRPFSTGGRASRVGAPDSKHGSL